MTTSSERRCAGGGGLLERGRPLLVLFPLTMVFACGSSISERALDPATSPAGEFEESCRVIEAGIGLPGSLGETSGLAVGMRDPAILWTHNDGGNPSIVFGLDRSGKKVAEFDVDIRNRDWEDMDIGSCGGSSCLYLADLGDNEERRDNLRVLRMVEPAPDVTAIDPARFDVTLPDGPRDIEAMYVLPGEELFFVTKGRNHPVTIYRYPGPLRDEDVVLEQVQTLGTVTSPINWITGASATRDGRHVAIRSYAALYLYEAREDGTLVLLPEGQVSLLPIGEPQGEAVAWGTDGMLYLTSEQRNSGAARMTVMECVIE